MRDLVWTIILIWLAWQFVNIFRRPPVKQAASSATPPEKQRNMSSLRRKKLDTEGEYVDFEEIR